MNYYIDFDNTLYETAKLTTNMIAAIGNKIGDLTGLEKEPIIQDAKDNFNSTLELLIALLINMTFSVFAAEKISYYREFFDYPNKFNHGKGCPLPTGPVTIELKDVHYRYDGAEKDTINGLNLTISAGESLALVGMNGAGKTTLIKLICGLYAPTSGEILVNGKHINEYNIEEYYSMISAVFQDIKTIAFSMFEFVASADMERESAREDAENGDISTIYVNIDEESTSELISSYATTYDVKSFIEDIADEFDEKKLKRIIPFIY